MKLTTKLDAVNAMLATIGEAPRNTLTGDKTADAARAINDLNEVTRLVQVEGWWFNTEESFTLVRDTNGIIMVPSNTIRLEIDPVKYRDVTPILRGDRLYDKKNRTYVFTQDIECQAIVVLLDFEQLPEPARQYAFIRASRVFQKRQLGSSTLHQLSQEEEFAARLALQTEEADSRQANILNNYYVQSITRRS
jgi:hypothetical protein